MRWRRRERRSKEPEGREKAQRMGEPARARLGGTGASAQLCGLILSPGHAQRLLGETRNCHHLHAGCHPLPATPALHASRSCWPVTDKGDRVQANLYSSPHPIQAETQRKTAQFLRIRETGRGTTRKVSAYPSGRNRLGKLRQARLPTGVST